jgi:hypothetical protein
MSDPDILDVHDQFLRKLNDLAKGELTPIDRYEVGGELNLPNDETDSIVTDLEARGSIKKLLPTKIMLTQEALNKLK